MKSTVKDALISIALLIGFCLILMFILGGCTDASRAKTFGLGDKFTVEMINCDGSVTHSFTSTGKVRSETDSDGYYFKDAETGKLVEVTGRLIITQAD